MRDAEARFTKREKDLLSKVPENGHSIGNGRLRETLGWESERYVEVKRSLINKGVLQPGRGRGGSVSRVVLPKGKAAGRRAGRGKKREKDSYPIFKKALETWAADQDWSEFFIEHKPAQGSKNTGGMWTRPDFVVVGQRKYEYTPGPVRDIETFEVKTSDFSMQAVFETAAHSRCATKSYLAIFRDDREAIDENLLTRAESECQRLQIGLLIFTKDTWDWRVEAVRKEPDPAEVEEFVEKQFEEKHKKQMRNWF